MKVINYLRTAWSSMLVPPWQRSKDGDVFDRAAEYALRFYSGTGDLAIHHPELLASITRWVTWMATWAWFLFALFLGAFVAPALIRFAGLTGSSFRYYAAVGIALLVGVIVHFFGLLPLFLADWAGSRLRESLSFRRLLVFMPIGLLLMCWPVAAVGYALYSYLAWIGPGQRLITTAFVWSVLLTTLAPAFKSVVLRYGVKRVIDWVRGGEKNTPDKTPIGGETDL